MTELDKSVQRLVDHDKETQRRAAQRVALIQAVQDCIRDLGHGASHECDPLEFRCGDVIVTVKNDWLIEWKIIGALRDAKEEQ